MYTTCFTKSLTQNWNLPNNTVWNPNKGSGNLHPNCFKGYEWIVANLLNFFKQKVVGVAGSVGLRWKMLFLPFRAIPKFNRSGSMTWWNVCSTASFLSLNPWIGLGIGTKKHVNSLPCYHGYYGNEETKFSLYYVAMSSN